MIEALAVLAVFSIIAAICIIIGMLLAGCMYYIIERWINPDAPSCRQFWIMVLFPVTIPIVIGYEVIKRIRGSFGIKKRS